MFHCSEKVKKECKKYSKYDCQNIYVQMLNNLIQNDIRLIKKNSKYINSICNSYYLPFSFKNTLKTTGNLIKWNRKDILIE